jgi:hypothetical protein
LSLISIASEISEDVELNRVKFLCKERLSGNICESNAEQSSIVQLLFGIIQERPELRAQISTEPVIQDALHGNLILTYLKEPFSLHSAKELARVLPGTIFYFERLNGTHDVFTFEKKSRFNIHKSNGSILKGRYKVKDNGWIELSFDPEPVPWPLHPTKLQITMVNSFKGVIEFVMMPEDDSDIIYVSYPNECKFN